MTRSAWRAIAVIACTPLLALAACTQPAPAPDDASPPAATNAAAPTAGPTAAPTNARPDTQGPTSPDPATQSSDDPAPEASPSATVSARPLTQADRRALERLRKLDVPQFQASDGSTTRPRLLLDRTLTGNLRQQVRLPRDGKLTIAVACEATGKDVLEHSVYVRALAPGGGDFRGSLRCWKDGSETFGGDIRATTLSMQADAPAGLMYRVWVWHG